MTPAQHRVVALARDWIDTPYAHGQSVRGAGCDCLGLVLGVARALGLAPELARYGDAADDAAEAEALRAGLARHLDAADDPAPGDVLLLRLRPGAPARHLGVLAETRDGPSLIHAHERFGVIESAFSESWRRRLAALFRWRIA